MTKTRGTLLAFAVLLAGCGGGDSSSDPPAIGNGLQYVAGQFRPASDYAAQCRVPRTGTNPETGKPYPDKPGSTTAENFWLRSWTNDLYLWYSEVPDLNPANTNDTESYFNLLKTTATTTTGAPKDKFHFIYNTADWLALAQSGASVGYGIDWEVVAAAPPRSVLVRYVEPGSAPAVAGVVRGMRLLLADGVDVVSDNTTAGVDRILEAMYPSTAGGSHQLRFSAASGAILNTSLTAAVINSDPVPMASTIVTQSGARVGYLLFTSHIEPAEPRLVSAINTLRAAAITDLVLDLRYNGGGYLDIASELSYMIAGPAQTAGKTFELVEFNSKHPVTNPVTDRPITPVRFYSTTQGFQGPAGVALPSLGLTRVYVLTTAETCSASESIINGLRGIGVAVYQIGTTTCGKPYGFYPQDNCGTTYFSIQYRGVNNAGFGDYTDGFSANRAAGIGDPRANLPGCAAKDDLAHALGDPAEELLRVAITYRESGTCTPLLPLSFGGQEPRQAAAMSGEGGAALVPPAQPWRENRIFR